MNKFIYLVVSVLAVLLVFTVNESNAKGSYGDDVDAFCLDSDPYAATQPDSCLLCHTDVSKGDSTPAQDAYLKGDLCYFCSNDTNCVGSSCVDGDGDRYFAQDGCGTLVDCNDNDAAMSPGMTEICDDIKDNDCNGLIDIQDPACSIIICNDLDGDGFSLEGGTCGPMDCNDNDVSMYPGAEDICNDGIDQDCSGKDRTKGKGCKTRSSEGKGKTCSDGLDNDRDGSFDCQDTDCARNRACR
jgi:hypothetical protein